MPRESSYVLDSYAVIGFLENETSEFLLAKLLPPSFQKSEMELSKDNRRQVEGIAGCCAIISTVSGTPSA